MEAITAPEKKQPNWRWSLIKYLLDKILHPSGNTSFVNIESALKNREETNENFLETLLRTGLLTGAELTAALNIQEHDFSLPQQTSTKKHNRELLGQLLLRAKLITPDQLACALTAQSHGTEKLGEIFVRLGFLKKDALQAVLKFQQHWEEGIISHKLQLGRILLAEGYVTKEQIEQVLARQKISPEKIGEILIGSGQLQPHHVDSALHMQQVLITCALILWLALAGMAVPPEANAANAISTEINVSATVLARTSVKTLSQVQQVIITEKEISQGYADFPAASIIAVRSNSRSGYLLTMELAGNSDHYLKTITVNVDGKETQLSPNGGYIPQAYAQGEVIKNISYRFILSENAQPGVYHWPLIVSVAPR